MNDKELKKIVRKVLMESVSPEILADIYNKLIDATSQYSWTMGGGTNEDEFLKQIQRIPDLESASKINAVAIKRRKMSLRDIIADEFNFGDGYFGNRTTLTPMFSHLNSIGVQVVNGDSKDGEGFDLIFSGPKEIPVINTPEKEQEVIVKKGGCTPAPSLDSICSGKSYLKNCMKGDSVTPVQNFLISKGFKSVSKTGTVDGIYGPMTKSMVMKYQASVGLKADGILGPQTISTMGICTKEVNNTPKPDVKPVIDNKPLPVDTNPDKEDVVETLCEITDKLVIGAYNSIKENMRADDPSFLRRECKIVINYQMENEKHCDNLQEVICFCGTKASSGEDGYAFMGDKKKYLKTYVSSYCKTDFTQDENKPAVLDSGKPTVAVEGCRTPGSVISILQQEDDKLSKDDCKILFSEAVNWYNSWKKCERKEHSANPAYKAKCFSCLNRFNFNWKDLGSGENKVVKMYGFNKREINKKQRRELPRMESVEALNRALLMMNYDMNKTLSENKERLNNIVK
jgi:hypothetical protein